LDFVFNSRIEKGGGKKRDQVTVWTRRKKKEERRGKGKVHRIVKSFHFPEDPFDFRLTTKKKKKKKRRKKTEPGAGNS